MASEMVGAVRLLKEGLSPRKDGGKREVREEGGRREKKHRMGGYSGGDRIWLACPLMGTVRVRTNVCRPWYPIPH